MSNYEHTILLVLIVIVILILIFYRKRSKVYYFVDKNDKKSLDILKKILKIFIHYLMYHILEKKNQVLIMIQ